jgi:hypothetical protein
MIGKTIAWIDESPRDPDYGGEDRGTIIIHFTDGGALKVEGWSHEGVDMNLEELSSEDVRRRSLAVQGQREKARLGRLKRQEWLSVSCDERKRRNAAQDKRGSFLLSDVYLDAYSDMIIAANRQLYGQPVKVRMICRNCGERSCENAPTKMIG